MNFNSSQNNPPGVRAPMTFFPRADDPPMSVQPSPQQMQQVQQMPYSQVPQQGQPMMYPQYIQPLQYGYMPNQTFTVFDASQKQDRDFIKDLIKIETAAINEDTTAINREIALLKQVMATIKVDMALAEDEAFSQVNLRDGLFYVIGKRGQPIVLCDISLIFCCHIIPDEAYKKEGYLMLLFKDRKPKIVPDKYLSKPTKLLQALAEAAGKPIKNCSNERGIGALLAQTLLATATNHILLYRCGWLKTADDGWIFQLCNGKTHCPKLPTNPEELPHTMILTELDHGATLSSVEQIVSMFEVIKSPAITRTLFLWWNAAFLFTLLAEGTNAENAAVLPMGLCVLCQGKYPRHCLERIFQFYNDPVISLGDEPDQFKRRLGQHKDQPLLIKDDFVSVKNEEVLTQALSSGSVPPVERNDEPLELRAAVTLLSEGKSVLGFNPNFISLELTDQDISQDILPRLPALAAFREDYFRGFAHFSQNNLELLQTLVKEMPTFNCSGSDQDYELSSNGAQVLATLRCVQRFVWAYLDSLAPSGNLAQRIQNLLSEDDTFLLELLENSYTVNDNLTHVFLGVAQRKLQDGSIRKISLRDVVATGAMPDAEDGIVYFDEKYLSVTVIVSKTVSYSRKKDMTQKQRSE